MPVKFKLSTFISLVPAAAFSRVAVPVTLTVSPLIVFPILNPDSVISLVPSYVLLPERFKLLFPIVTFTFPAELRLLIL